MASTMTSPPSPLLYRLHLALTALLVVGLLAFAGLAAAGRVRFGGPAQPAPSTGGGDRAAAANTGKQTSKGKDRKKEKSEEKPGGRYQIEMLDEARQVLSETGKLGMLGENVSHVWVFRYKGGFAEARLETDFNGKPVSSGQIPPPRDWPRFLGQDDGIKQGNPLALRKEGYIILMGVQAVLPIGEALRPLQPHLGGMFTVGPAGPLHTLVPYYREVWRQREYRLFLSAGPPKGEAGPGFNLWAGDLVLVRSHFVDDASGTDPGHPTTGKDLEPGNELVILEHNRGLSKIRLKARFLTDQEVLDKVKGK